MVDLDIPSSGNFTQLDLKMLWEAGQELGRWRSRLAMTSPDHSYAQAESIGRTGTLADWHAVELCAFEAKRLLSKWPTRIGRELRWVPVGIGGGFEDLSYTEREVLRVGHLAHHNDDSVVARTARWFGLGEQITLSAVSSLANEVTTLVERTLNDRDRHKLHSLTWPIHQVALQSAAPPHRADPEPSSWHPAFTRFAASCLRVLAELHADQRGDQTVPLLDTDELYEAWLAITVRDFVSELLELRVSPSRGAMASWVTGAMTIDLRVKPAVARATEIGQDTFRALVARTLLPDVMVTATRGNLTEVAVLDAKAWAKMLPEDVLSESAKYLYGIRRVGSEQIPAVASMHIVSCAVPPQLPDATEAKIGFVHATPSAGEADMKTAVVDVLASLTAAIERREQEASLLT